DGFTAVGEVTLVSAAIGDSLQCRAATFSNVGKIALDLEGAKISRSLILKSLSSSPDGVVDLSFSHTGQLSDDSTSWPDRGLLILQGLTYEGIAGATDSETRLEWLNRQPRGQFRPQPYEQLIRILREMGHDRDAQKIAIAKQIALRESGE